MDLTVGYDSIRDDYDPKKKTRGRKRTVRARLAVAFFGVLVVGVIVFAGGRGAQQSPSAPPADAKAQDASSGAAAAPGAQAPPSPPKLKHSLAERMSVVPPNYRGQGKSEIFPGFANANRLLLATHNRLMWYRYDTDELRVIHEGQGVYYGAFPGEGRDALGAPTDLWVVSRPHNWRPTTTKEHLLHLHIETGEELGWVEIASRFTHDAVRRRGRVWVANTGGGSVLELRFPDMKLERELALFTPEQHINTLAPTPDDKLWVLQHNLGTSALAEVDLQSGSVLRRIEGVGDKSHGIVFWDRFMVVLDSDGGGLLLVDPKTSEVTTVWKLDNPSFFLKGLAIVDDIAFFGVAPHTQRGNRADPSMNCHLAAFDLKMRLLLWQRQLPTHGLLNVVAAPHLQVESTSWSINTAAQITYRYKPGYTAALEEARAKAPQPPPSPAAHNGQAADARAAVAGEAVLDRQQLLEQGGAGAGAGQQAAGGLLLQQQQQQGHGLGQHSLGARVRPRQVREDHAQHALHAEHAHAEHAHAEHGVAPRLEAGDEGAAGTAGGHQRPDALRLSLSETEKLAANDPVGQFPPHIGGYWSSGWPYMDTEAKALKGFQAGLQLLLFRTDVSQLKAFLLSLRDEEWTDQYQAKHNAYLIGRKGNLDTIKPGARSIVLQFSDNRGTVTARYPWYHRFAPLLEPLLKEVLGERDMANIIRLQFAHMAPHTQIKLHQDVGGYAAHAHRIHAIIATNPQVVFAQCQGHSILGVGGEVAVAARIARGQPIGEEGCAPIHANEEGLVFELNNRLKHFVINGGDEARIHMVVDVAEGPLTPMELRVGQTCDYSKGTIDC